MLKKSNDQLQGAVFVALAYVLWGILPVYWKLLKHVPSEQVLCHRVIWCVGFMLALLLVTGNWNGFISELQAILNQPKKLWGIVFAGIFLNLNWFTYIWAVNHNHVIQTSLGYYINPLVSVLLGMIFLKEKLSVWESVAFVLALLGVLYITIHLGSFPWIAILLALTFGIYGLLKKTVGAGAMTGLTLETLVMTVPAILYIVVVHHAGNGAFGNVALTTTLLLFGAGAVTGIPLLLFASGVLRLPMTIIGFLQYISPTLTLLLGIFLYHEPFTAAHLISFVLIWLGLVIFTVARGGSLRGKEQEEAC